MSENRGQKCPSCGDPGPPVMHCENCGHDREMSETQEQWMDRHNAPWLKRTPPDEDVLEKIKERCDRPPHLQQFHPAPVQDDKVGAFPTEEEFMDAAITASREHPPQHSERVSFQDGTKWAYRHLTGREE